jgi:anti-sigma28 factor (negative regulator of flagellin synthesis)
MAKHSGELEQKWRAQKLERMQQQIADGSLVVKRLSPEQLANYRPGKPQSTQRHRGCPDS